MKNLVLFWGWFKGDNTYKKILESSPADYKVHVVSFPELLANGWKNAVGDNFVDILDQKKLGKVDVFGHSLGGALAMLATHEHQARVNRLIISDAEGVYEPQPPWELLKNLIFPGPNTKIVKEELVSSVYKILRRLSLMARLSYLAHTIDLQEEAAQIKVPTRIIWGEQDLLTPLSQGVILHGLIPNSELIVLPNEGHNWILETPEKFWQNIVQDNN